MDCNKIFFPSTLFWHITLLFIFALIIFDFSALPCWWNVSRLCAEGFWIRANFLPEVRWEEEHPICQASFVNLAFRVYSVHPTPIRREHTHINYLQLIHGNVYFLFGLYNRLFSKKKKDFWGGFFSIIIMIIFYKLTIRH